MILYEYQEATAITVENQVAGELGYSLRNEIGVYDDGEPMYGCFPAELSMKGAQKSAAGRMEYNKIFTATTIKTYGTGIAKYMLDIYGD